MTHTHSAILFAALLAVPVLAQEGASTPPVTQPKSFDVTLEVSGDHALRTDVDGGGDVAVTRAMVSAVISRSFGEGFRGTLLVSNEWTWYDFDNAAGLIAGTGRPFG